MSVELMISPADTLVAGCRTNYTLLSLLLEYLVDCTECTK